MNTAVVIPFYNEQLHIGDTLASFSRYIRAVPGCRFVLVDNNSTDSTARTAAAALTRSGIAFDLLTEPRQGVAYARHTGLEHAYGAGAELIMSTDADTQLPEDNVGLLETELAGFRTSRYDVYTAQAALAPDVQLRKLILLGDYVSAKRRMWNLYYRLFGPYAFGAFYVVKRGFYGRLREHVIPRRGNILAEDVLFSRRAYFIGGRFLRSRTMSLQTSSRRFLADPAGWLTGTRHGEWRGTDNTELTIPEIAPDRIRRLMVADAARVLTGYYRDAYGFDRLSGRVYSRPMRCLTRFSAYFGFTEPAAGKTVPSPAVVARRMSAIRSRLMRVLFP
jgi:glycosyltransferase involved in cell wall biosynthesis